MVSNIAALIRVVGFSVRERGRVGFQGERESARESQREKEMKCRQKFAWPQKKVHPTSARSASVDDIEISLAQMSRGPGIAFQFGIFTTTGRFVFL